MTTLTIPAPEPNPAFGANPFYGGPAPASAPFGVNQPPGAQASAFGLAPAATPMSAFAVHNPPSGLIASSSAPSLNPFGQAAFRQDQGPGLGLGSKYSAFDGFSSATDVRMASNPVQAAQTNILLPQTTAVPATDLPVRTPPAPDPSQPFRSAPKMTLFYIYALKYTDALKNWF